MSRMYVRVVLCYVVKWVKLEIRALFVVELVRWREVVEMWYVYVCNEAG